MIAIKVRTRDDATRPQDLADLRALVRSAYPTDLSDAREAAALIERRGYNRDRDLQKALDELVAELLP